MPTRYSCYSFKQNPAYKRLPKVGPQMMEEPKQELLRSFLARIGFYGENWSDACCSIIS
jgi:hypothetical protein